MPGPPTAPASCRGIWQLPLCKGLRRSHLNLRPGAPRGPVSPTLRRRLVGPGDSLSTPTAPRGRCRAIWADGVLTGPGAREARPPRAPTLASLCPTPGPSQGPGSRARARGAAPASCTGVTVRQGPANPNSAATRLIGARPVLGRTYQLFTLSPGHLVTGHHPTGDRGRGTGADLPTAPRPPGARRTGLRATDPFSRLPPLSPATPGGRPCAVLPLAWSLREG